MTEFSTFQMSSCRLCNASSTKLTSSIYDEVVSKFLDLIPHIQLEFNSNFSTSVCQLCYGKAKIAFDFITRIEQAQHEIEKQKKAAKRPLKIESALEHIQQVGGISVRKVSAINKDAAFYDDEEVVEVDEDHFIEDVYEPEDDEEDIIDSEEDDEDEDDEYKPAKVSPSKRKKLTKPATSPKSKQNEKVIFIDAPVNFTCAKCKSK
jgi:hypothetical protein